MLAATTDPAVITGWYDEMPTAGVGINAGKSHLLILDVDRHNVDRPAADRILPGIDLPEDIALGSIRDGEDVLALLCEIRGVAALTIDNPTMTIRTPSGGLQLWWRVEPEQEWTPSAGKLGWQLDVRAGRSYGIAPGTVTPTGAYTAYGACRTIAPLPTWLAADLKRTGHYVEPKPTRRRVKASQLLAGMTPKGDRYVAAAVEAEITQLAHTGEGGRNEATFNAARALGRFIPTGQLTEREVEDMVVGAARAAGLSEQEATAAARSGIRTRTARGVSA